ncbi:unnamed protein product, partial [marine sediment metagenome]
MAYPVYESFAEEKVSTLESSIVIDKPAGVAENDLMVAVIAQGRSGDPWTMTPPGGWSTFYNGTYYGGATLSAFYKIAGDSEPSDYTFTFDATQRAYGFIIRVSGVRVADPINIFDKESDATDTPRSPSVVTTEDECLILRAFAMDNIFITEDSGYPAAHTG